MGGMVAKQIKEQKIDSRATNGLKGGLIDNPAGLAFFLLSLVLHALIFFGVIVFCNFSLPRTLPQVIEIDLVSFAPGAPAVKPAEAEEAQKAIKAKDDGVSIKSKTSQTPASQKKERQVPTIKPDISLKTKPKNIKELMAEKDKPKKKEVKKQKKPAAETPKPKAEPEKKSEPEETIDADKLLKEEADRLSQKVADQKKEQIDQALARLARKVKEQDATKEGTGIAGPGNGSYVGHGQKGYKPIDIYNLLIGSTIEQNWVFSDMLARMNQDLEVRILIKVLKNGEIRDIIYETKSGNHYLDESAKKAIQKSNPLPPLPDGLYSYDVGLIFTPKGLK